MCEVDVIVIGAGPAGLSAAIEAKRSGLSVEIIEQRATIGGAVFRQPIDGVSPVSQPAAARKRWTDLNQAFRDLEIPVRHGTVFLGIDGDRAVLVEDRSSGKVRAVAARAVIIAVGAVERVLPRPGWEMPGVSTVGGLQVTMKETGRAPAGRILLAGSGPLLVAVAAQMARLGTPPVAIVEAGDPVRRLSAGLALCAHPGLLAEAAGYFGSVLRHRVPWLRATSLVRIDKTENAFAAVVRSRNGRDRVFTVDRIGLHDGIAPNRIGLPDENQDSNILPLILRTGDCREALGVVAALADGRRAGREVALRLSARHGSKRDGLSRHRSAQEVLGRMFAPVADTSLQHLPDETVLCRCENRTVADLRTLCRGQDALTGREIKHNGRFAMGACQGRFCAANTAALIATLRPDAPPPAPTDLTGRRWPLRPVPIGALAASEAATPASQDEPTNP